MQNNAYLHCHIIPERKFLLLTLKIYTLKKIITKLKVYRSISMISSSTILGILGIHPGKKPDELRFWDVSLLMTGFISLKDLQVIYETHADCRMEINIYVHLTTYKYKLVIHGLSQHLIGAWAKIGLTGLTHLKNLKTKSRKIEKGKSVWWLVPFFRMKKLSK